MFGRFAYTCVQTFVSRIPSMIKHLQLRQGSARYASTHSFATTVMPSEGATIFSAPVVEELKTLAAVTIVVIVETMENVIIFFGVC